jgi:hypothetical protein
MADFVPTPYRIRIGITGHRNLKDPAAIQVLVKQVIDTEIWKLFSEGSLRNIERVRRAGTTSISYRVLSPLAGIVSRSMALSLMEHESRSVWIHISVAPSLTTKMDRTGIG